MNIIKSKKILLKRIELVVCFVLLVSLININSNNASAVNQQLPNEPSFDVKINSATPNPALIGEDITINGTIMPQPFETEAKSQKKEIVLVLDVSGSMDDEVDEKCTNQRGRHEVSWYEANQLYYKGIDIIYKNGHYYVDDYCEEHGKIGEHNSTKITELKKAANNFIDKMKSVSNLKIGIVAYSTNATINPGTYQDGFLDDSDTLHNIVNGLRVDGGTNTGEGLRKAEYMLKNGETDAKKTIVFMSDGEPTFYSAEEKYEWNYGRYYDYYTSIDNTNPAHGGPGNSDNQGYCKEYAEKIGAIIKQNKSNIFSIGYGLEDYGNETMKDIHESMGGISDNKHFFATGSGAIDGVFSGIADEIIKSYTIDSLTANMNFNSNDGFSLNIGGNTVKLDNIVYNKVDNSETNGKWRYEAASIPFSFIIKGSKPGEYNNIFKDSNVTFTWEGNAISGPINQNNLKIVIKDNELPNIEANLESAAPNPINNLNQEITLNYGINPNSFTFANNNGSDLKDVVILLDNSNVMGDSKLGKIKDNLFNKILNDNTLKNQKTSYALVTYNNSATIKSDFVSSQSEITSFNDNVLKSIGSEKGARNIVDAFNKAQTLLQGGRSNAKKYILLISSGKASGSIKDIDAKIDEIKGKYNLISLDLSNINSANVDDILYNDDNDENNDNNHFIKYFHLKSGGQKEDYFINKNYDASNSNPCLNDDNNIANSIMDAIAKRLKGGAMSSYVFNDLKLNFNIGDNFQLVQNSNSDLVKNMEVTGNGNITLTLPTIEYRLDSTGKYVAWYEDKDGQYKTWGSDKNLFYVSFKVKPNKYEEALGFGTPNTISYTSLLGKSISKSIETPIINVRGIQEVIHGLYSGMNEDGTPNIESATSKDFLQGTNVRLGATFKAYNGSVANLIVDTGNVDRNNINVYKIVDGKLNLIGKMVPDDSNNNYKFNFSEEGNMLVIYNETLPKPTESHFYTNHITVDNANATAKLHVLVKELPELF